ncbi:MAG: phage tail tape measure protein [Bacteroidetes bacterium 41-46]|nr:MAG: phage tail tape measure protein [Bacteroidetes bacterium 41-46]
MANQVVFNIQFSGNAGTFSAQLTQQMGALQGATQSVTSSFTKFQAKLIALNQGIQLLRDFAGTLRDASEPGLKLNAAMQDLSAITGVTGSKLQEIEGYARDAAKTFGGSAAQGVESYKLILSQLSPEIAKVPVALRAMGQSAATLSKTMQNDVVGATEVLTTAMNQYQVSLDDPIAASRVMSEMMNTMAAAAQEGSAELPQIKQALEQAGMAAKMANVSFAETNAAIQVLDKAGKKGSEGGVAIRNVLATLSEGRFLPKEVRKELAAAGVSIEVLADKTLPLASRLSELTKITNDSALITKLFGKENSNAALALISGIPLMQQYTSAIQGTKSAEEQAAVVMQSKEQQLARIKAKIDDYKIAIFNLTGNMLPFAEIATSALVPISQMIPLISALSKGIKAFSFTSVIAGFTAFKVSAIASCRAVGVAIMSIPVFGWIAAALAALGAAAVWAWNKFEGFRKTVMGVWEIVKLFGITLYDSVLGAIKGIISGLGSLGSALLKLFKFDFKGAAAEAKSAMAAFSSASPIKVGVNVATADYRGAWAAGQQKGAESWANKDKKDMDEAAESAGNLANGLNGVSQATGNAAAGSGTMAEEITKLKDKLIAITKVNELFGSSHDALKEKITAVQGTITEMVEKGFKVESKEIQSLLTLLATLNDENRKLTEGYTRAAQAANILANANKKVGVRGTSPEIGKTNVKDINAGAIAMQNYKKSMGEVNDSFELFGDSQSYISNQMSVVRGAIDDLLEKGYKKSSRQIQLLMKEYRTLAKTVSIDISSFIASGITGVAEGLGEALGSGDWAAGFKNILLGLMDMLKQFGAALIAQGVAVLALKASMSNPYAAMIAGAGLVLAASAAQSAMKRATNFADGGIVYGETFARVGEYAGASNNPEVIAPLDKLKGILKMEQQPLAGEVTFIIKDDVLAGVLKRYNNKRRLV